MPGSAIVDERALCFASSYPSGISHPGTVLFFQGQALHCFIGAPPSSASLFPFGKAQARID